MFRDVSVLQPEQIEELSNIVHGILEENKKQLEDLLNERVEIQTTTLYKLACQQWSAKRKIVDNLCHFSLTMMASVQLLWEHRNQQRERLDQAEARIAIIQRQADDLSDINEVYRQKISEAQIKIESMTEVKQKIQEIIRSQSCINFSQELNNAQGKEQKYLACEDCIQLKKQTAQKEGTIKNLQDQKVILEEQLQKVREQSQLVRMELQLAEIAIKDALTYKSSYKSLLEANPSRLSQVSKLKSNIHYYQEQGQQLNNSFGQEPRNLLSNQFNCRQDIVRFASTPCLLLNQSIEKLSMDNSLSNLKEENAVANTLNNPFKKKSNMQLQQNSIVKQQSIKQSDNLLPNVENKFNKTFELQNQSKLESSSNLFEPYRPAVQSQIIDQSRIIDMISRFKIKQSKISDKEETEQSSVAPSSPQIRRKENSKKVRSNLSSDSSTLSRFYSFVSNKIVKSRIRLK